MGSKLLLDHEMIWTVASLLKDILLRSRHKGITGRSGESEFRAVEKPKVFRSKVTHKLVFFWFCSRSFVCGVKGVVSISVP